MGLMSNCTFLVFRLKRAVIKNKKNATSYNEEINDVILKIENIFGANIANEINVKTEILWRLH